MRKSKSQNEKLLNALQRGQKVTSQTAWTRFGIQRLPARVYDLREDGYNVQTDFVTRQGIRMASYSL